MVMTLREQRRCDERVAMVACGMAMAALVPVAARQLGVIEHLPDPPLRVFDSDRIVRSKTAHPFGVPDAVLGLGSYAATMLLLMAARGRSPVAQKLLEMKLKSDASAAMFNVARQPLKFRKLCSWCMGAALATGAMVVFARRAHRG